ncbi:MAG: RagB/SusD family nutrient uptake outer membrane protein [Bacteroidota bacterium]|nr:RagB/SusD family nutrient uptake outer membrane protein [Bacteroidota bacterium]
MKLKNIITMTMVTCLFCACDLNEEPYGFYSEGNFLNTPEDAEAGIGYAYDALTFLEYSRTVFYLGDMPSEEVSPKPDEGAGARDLDTWKVENFSTNPSLMNFFKYAYIAVNRANIILEKIEPANFDQALKDQYLGEAHFLRAWNYFNLVRNFGLVPMHTTTVSALDQTAAPLATSLDQVYNLILSDCRKASELLPIQQATGRADRVAAQSLAAKVYLYIASAKEHDVPLYGAMGKDVATMYDSAAYYSGEVLNSQSVYKFEDDLLTIYDVQQPKGSEHIFLMSMDRSGVIEGDYSKISKMFIPYVAGGDIYLDNQNGSYTKSHDGWSVFQTGTEFLNTFEDGDLRADLLIVDSVYNAEGGLIAQYPGSLPYPFSRKYVDPLFIADKTSVKPFLIRFSDIALVYAEAVGPTPEGYLQVDYIRERAGLGPLNPGLDLQSFREAVWRERSWELAFEGNRLYDLRRYNRVTSVVPEAAGLTPEQAAFYPIPQVEVDLNQGL